MSIPANYRAFCRVSKIPLPETSFYSVLSEINKKRRSGEKWTEDVYDGLVLRLEQLKRFIDDEIERYSKSPKTAVRIINAYRLFFDHEKSLRDMGCNLFDKDEIDKMRKSCAKLIREIEHREQAGLVGRLSEEYLPNFVRESLIRDIKIIGRRTRGIDNWAGLAREATVALEDRGFSYP